MKSLRFALPCTIFQILLSVANSVPEGGRMITKEELALHDGNQTKEMWLSILSQVYDVSKGEEYYAPGSGYSIFAGRDANVPFVTGKFDPEEAEKPLTELTPMQLHSLQHWAEFYENEEKYPFVGFLVGELYDETGKPTEAMAQVKEKIAEAQVIIAEKKKKTAEIIARRKVEDAEKKRLALEKAQAAESNSAKEEL
jgi:predicted heme/steroid binding protein